MIIHFFSFRKLCQAVKVAGLMYLVHLYILIINFCRLMQWIVISTDFTSSSFKCICIVSMENFHGKLMYLVYSVISSSTTKHPYQWILVDI